MNRLRALLLADDDERRAIERQLHDGVQQLLVAVAVDLQLARNLVEADPRAATRLLDDIRGVVGESIDDLRRLAQRIHPPLLDTQGLVTALRMAAAAAPVTTRVEGALERRVPPEVAVTVYRCCVTTLAAAVAHGESPRATIAVSATKSNLEFDVALSGADVEAGALEPLAGRVDALGGELDVGPNRVTGRLPLSS